MKAIKRFLTKLGAVQVGKVYVDREDLATRVKVLKLAPFGGSVDVGYGDASGGPVIGGKSAGVFRACYCTEREAVKARKDREALRKELNG